ncbi:MAG: fumarate hydratase, partial [Rikenellaceae bacterium]
MSEFKYQEPFPISKDDTKYRLLSKEGVETINVDGREILKVSPKAIEMLSREAFKDVSFFLRASHLQKLVNIIND